MDDLWSTVTSALPCTDVTGSVEVPRQMDARGALSGVRVLILRPREQASALRERLEGFGACTVTLPVIEIAPPDSLAELDRALGMLGEFDWLVLTSANAVDAVARRLPDGLHIKRLAVVGAATLARVREAEIPEPLLAPTLVPPRAVAESLADELEPRIRQLVQQQGRASVLLPRAETARDVLPERLRQAGAVVTSVAAYRNRVPQESIPLLQQIFARRELWPEAIPFTSSSSVTNLLAVLAAAGQVLPGEILRVSIGPVTSATLCEHGMPAHAEAAEATIDAMAAAVVNAIARQRRTAG